MKPWILSLLLVLSLPLSSPIQASSLKTHYTSVNVTYVSALAFQNDTILWAGGYGLVRWNLARGSYESISNVSGLIYAIAVDQLGNVWFGTIDGGVHEFDGENWKDYSSQVGITKIHAIVIDRQGNKWFGTWGGGVTKFDGTKWTTYTVSDGLADNWVNAIALDPQGVIWIGTTGGVSRFDGSGWTTYTTANGLAGNEVLAVAIDAKENKWFGTGSGVSRFDGTNWTTYTTRDGLAQDRVNDIAVDTQDNKWFATDSGASRLSGSAWTTYTTADGLSHKRVLSVAVGPQGRIWFGTESREISIFDGTSWSSFDVLASDNIKAMAIDRDGNKWFGTDKGVSKFDGKQWVTYTKADGLADDNVDVIAIDRENNKWFGTYPGGVSKFDGITWTTYTTADGLVDNSVISIAIDSKGVKWFKTSRGVSKFDGSTWTTYTTGLVSGYALPMAIDLQDNKWFCTDKGVIRFDGTTWTTYLPSSIVREITVDAGGSLWFLTGQGVSKFDGTNWKTYTVYDGLCSNSISLISADGQGNLWFLGNLYGGTDLCKFDGTHWQPYSFYKTNYHIYTTAIAFDAGGNMWFSTNGDSGYNGSGVYVYAKGFENPEISLSTADSIDLGNVEVGSRGEANFYIRNDGVVDLFVSAIEIVSSDTTFKLNLSSYQAVPQTLSANGSIQVYLYFSPTRSGAQSTRITIKSDDPDEGTLTLTVTGYGIAACTLPGDVTFDYEVDIFDILNIVRFALGQKTPTAQETACADMNEDGKIDVLDVLACVDKAVGRSLQLAASSPETFARIDRTQLKSDLVSLGADQKLIADVFSLLEQQAPSLPKVFSLSQNAPNPFNPATTISYAIPAGQAVQVTLKVFDLRGRLVRALVAEERQPGAYSVFWDSRDENGRQVSSGVYFYRMQAGDFIRTRKMVLLK